MTPRRGEIYWVEFDPIRGSGRLSPKTLSAVDQALKYNLGLA